MSIAYLLTLIIVSLIITTTINNTAIDILNEEFEQEANMVNRDNSSSSECTSTYYNAHGSQVTTVYDVVLI
jgi:hypothetical protein